MTEGELRIGIDIGSTTVKVVVLEKDTNDILYSKYERHNAHQIETLKGLLAEVQKVFPHAVMRMAVCGSGARPAAEALGVHYIQEVVANAAAIEALYPEARTAVELGGQDAKVIFFYYDEASHQLNTSDMRMNGSCAGGTGAFLDEIAKLLNVPVNEFNALVEEGSHVYEISGRCGVFAKTDIQPLLTQGALRSDIALSTFHAVAKQTIGGLSQGLDLTPPIIFEGGPLTFNPKLVDVFAQRLDLSEKDIILPDHPETIVARGTAIAVDQLFPDDTNDRMTIAEALERLEKKPDVLMEAQKGRPFFQNEEEKQIFLARHQKELKHVSSIGNPNALRVYIGIDSGSTTSKFVIMDEEENVIDTYYENNNGEALLVIKKGLLSIYRKYQDKGIDLEVLGVGTTGYGEMMTAQALQADYHTVETVAHARGCLKYVPDATFILDIGGQDMKGIWLKDGIITNIVLNEACSSGCGSFLENFASTLNIPVEEVSEAAFRSQNPAVLGSRCTVFMNSTIVNEQRSGKTGDDIMAGLCRSIIENVFTKVIRIANTAELGDKIVVQGGTFRNQAVLKALEDRVGHDVVLAPYPGEMGALGAAIAAKDHIERNGYANGVSSSFIGFDALAKLTWKREVGVSCSFCSNHCRRTITTFNTGTGFVTGNRCERGAILTEDKNERILQAKRIQDSMNRAPDLMRKRTELLFQNKEVTPICDNSSITIGIPRVLEFWDSMPFWTTFFKTLGFRVKLSSMSSRRQYEEGLKYVASDTICFPAKLVHGHINELSKQNVDRIFLPYIMHMPKENKKENSTYVCPVIMGYPMVIRNFQSPEHNHHIKFDTPVFHWFSERDRKKQICDYAVKTLGVSARNAETAYQTSIKEMASYKETLREECQNIIQKAEEEDKIVIVLAGRPYHSDPLVNHDIAKLFTKKGIAVVTVDSLPGLEDCDLHKSRAEITNDFHARMLAGAMVAAATPNLEYVQIVSFGCGHDAILSDEITRILAEGGKTPLILKVDESDAAGSLSIRVQSFIETMEMRRQNNKLSASSFAMPSPYPVKYTKADKQLKTLLIPNVSQPVSVLLQGLLKKEGIKAVTLPIGGLEEIAVGKKYTHNDICFPCQMVVGELINALEKGDYKKGEVAVGMAKLQCDCRMANYSAILRKGLDNAGFSDVPILTTDPSDTKGMHPGVSMIGIKTIVEAAWVFVMLDILEDLLRKIRPYECNKGETNKVFNDCISRIAEASANGLHQAVNAFRTAIDAFMKIPYDRTVLKPRVLVTGELLVTYHKGTNFHIEEYLENNGMETILPRITYQFRKDFLAGMSEIKDFKAKIAPYPFALNKIMAYIQNRLEKIAVKHPLYHKAVDPQSLYDEVEDIIPETLTCGEGWLMAGEIVHYAKQDVKSFIILQPFGCLPNHVCGRGVTKRIKEKFPDVQILPLDLDPDTSYANVENRLQMLIMNHAGSSVLKPKNVTVSALG